MLSIYIFTITTLTITVSLPLNFGTERHWPRGEKPTANHLLLTS